MSFKEFTDLVTNTAPCCRYDERSPVSEVVLSELVGYAKYTQLEHNLPQFEYIVSYNSDLNKKIFCTLDWTGIESEMKPPAKGERPTAYIMILTDYPVSEETEIASGAAVQTILLAATSKGLGSCLFNNLQRDRLNKYLNIPGDQYILLVIAIGKPLEKYTLGEGFSKKFS